MNQYIIFGALILAICLFSFNQTIKELHSKYYGQEVEGLCIKTPKLCNSRNNRIEIIYANRKYKPIIGVNACIDRKYILGDKYIFLYSDKFDHMIIPERKPQLLIPLFIGIIGLSVFCFVKGLRSYS